MKHIISILMLLVMLASCELKTSDNGQLDGFWIIVQVDTLSTGHSTYMAEKYNSWSFQFNLLELRNRDNFYFCRFSHNGDSLAITEIYDNNFTEDQPVTDPSRLAPFAISHVPTRFHIEHLTDEHMVLADESLRVTLKKI